jgi:DNA-binding transcriptional LysR family regulator
VAPVLTELAREHPELILELSFSDRVINLVDEGFDFAVRNGQLEDSSELVARQLSWHDMRLCAAPSYLARYGTPDSPDKLMQHQAIYYMNKSRPLEWQLTIHGQIERFRPEGRLFMDDLDAIADAAEAGDGIAWLPYWLINERLHSKRLVQILPDTAGPPSYSCGLAKNALATAQGSYCCRSPARETATSHRLKGLVFVGKKQLITQ